MISYGVNNGVAYFPGGEPWNGLISVDELDPFDSEVLFADGRPYGHATKVGSYSGKIQAFTYPPTLDEYIGRKRFGLSYQNIADDGYDIHLVYNVLMKPTQRSRNTMSNVPEPINLQFDFECTPERINGFRPASHLIFRSAEGTFSGLSALEDAIYGDTATLPSPDEVVSLVTDSAVLLIVDHGDGTWTASGPDDMVSYLDATTFQITSPSLFYTAPDRYTVSSW